VTEFFNAERFSQKNTQTGRRFWLFENVPLPQNELFVERIHETHIPIKIP
jgi:hypothetical protein